MMTRVDKLIFFVLVFGAVSAMLASQLLFAAQNASTVLVEIDGKEYGRYNLQEKNSQTLAIESKFGYNKIVIANGRVYVCESDCPDTLEIKAGAIQKAGQMLVCLPNRLVVRIEGRRDVDGVAY